jgi:hypothetical protein
MARTPLARLVDRDALDASRGARARLRIEVPAAWIEEGAVVEITAPGRLPCAGCEGGGCDACGRSGALRAPEDPADRVVSAGLPGAGAPRGASVAIRLVRPFGDRSAIDHLLVELRAGPTPSVGVRRLAPPPPAASPPGAALPWGAIAAAAVAIAAILAALLAR